MAKERREEYFFVKKYLEEEDELFPVYETDLVVDYRVGGIHASDLSSLYLGGGLNLTFYEMEDLRQQVISVNDNNDLAPENIPHQVTHKDNPLNCKPEGIIFPRLSNSLHHIYAAFKNYYCEGVTPMIKFELFLIFFTSYNPKLLLIHGNIFF